MRRLRLVALAAVALASTGARDAASQSDPRLAIDGGTPDFLTLVGPANGAPVDLVQLLPSSPGTAADGVPAPLAGMAPTQCASAQGVAVHPNGRFVYTTSAGVPAGSVCAYDFAANRLTPAFGSPIGAGRGTRAVAVDPAGKYLYAANFTDGTISGFAIDEATGELRALGASPFVSADSNTGHLAIDPLGRFLFASNSDPLNPSVSGFAIDRDNGGLTPVPFSPLPQKSAPGALAIDPRGRYLYVASAPNQVYAIHPVTGQITATADTFAPFAEGMAIDPAGRYLYATSGAGAGSRRAVGSRGAEGLQGREMTGELKPGAPLLGRIVGRRDATTWTLDFDLALPTKDAAAGMSCDN